MLAKHKHRIENPEALSVVIKEVGKEVNAKKTKCMFKFLKIMQDKITVPGLG